MLLINNYIIYQAHILYVIYYPAVSEVLIILNTSPLLNPKYLETGSLYKILGSYEELILYFFNNSVFSSSESFTCLGTNLCLVML
mmetsp:Transcript_16558/g.1483  ORF Transcript_16558/g.1483 Transcript_16558/m.1483 type:complete len:85 (+) Transcript_16558:14-268(+)